MYMGHRKVLHLAHEEIMRRKTAYQNGHELFIHEKMASPGTKSFFVSMTRYPVVSVEFVLQKNCGTGPSCGELQHDTARECA
jgi:hypothetical protein